MTWGKFTLLSVGLTGLFLASILAFNVALDPYGAFGLSKPVDLAMAYVGDDERNHPAIGLETEFDSAIVGTSAAKAYDPERLGRPLGARVANLSVLGADPWEQMEMARRFLARHPVPKVLAIDVIYMKWCRASATSRDWLAGRGRLAGWLLNGSLIGKTLAHLSLWATDAAANQLKFSLGARHGLTLANYHLHYLAAPPGSPPPKIDGYLTGMAGQNAQNPLLAMFTDHALLSALLEDIPDDTLKVLVFTPLPDASYPAPGTLEARLLAQCKQRLETMVLSRPNAAVFDLLKGSPLTGDRENFQPPFHLLPDAADRFVDMLGRAIAEGHGDGAFVRYVTSAAR